MSASVRRLCREELSLSIWFWGKYVGGVLGVSLYLGVLVQEASRLPNLNVITSTVEYLCWAPPPPKNHNLLVRLHVSPLRAAQSSQSSSRHVIVSPYIYFCL